MSKTKNKKRVFDNSKLTGRMKELHLTQDDVSQYLGINKSTFNLKINSRVIFTQDEISQLIEFLKIPDEEIRIYFFKQKVYK